MYGHGKSYGVIDKRDMGIKNNMGNNMNYYFTGILIILMTMLAVFVKPAYPAESQTNVSGSNTSIEGGYTGGATTYQSGHPLILQVQLTQHQMLSQHHQQHQHRHIIL